MERSGKVPDFLVQPVTIFDRIPTNWLTCFCLSCPVQHTKELLPSSAGRRCRPFASVAARVTYTAARASPSPNPFPTRPSNRQGRHGVEMTLGRPGRRAEREAERRASLRRAAAARGPRSGRSGRRGHAVRRPGEGRERMGRQRRPRRAGQARLNRKKYRPTVAFWGRATRATRATRHPTRHLHLYATPPTAVASTKTRAAVRAAFRTAGQRCSWARR